MDYYTIVLTCCFVIFAHAAHIPEVYESNGSKHVQDNYEQAPVFNYQEYQETQKGNQFDPQRVRYQQQQQQADTKPRQAKSLDFLTASTNSSKTNTDAWTPISTPGSLTITASSQVALEDLERESPQAHIPKGKIAKKSLKQNSYLVNEESETAGKRQDDSSWINYADRNPKSLSQNLGGYSVAPSGGSDQLSALSSLLGQTPQDQLHGLQQLLNNRQRSQLSQPQGSYYKDHTPVKEDVWDLPNLQNKPNIKGSQGQGQNRVVNQALQSYQLNKQGNNPNSLTSLQAQLDATATAHAENILAEAQKKALEHVKAQHEAIARAQKQAELAALEQIKVQNEGLAREHAQAEAAAEEQRQAEDNEKKEKRKAADRRRHQEQARERARIAALAYKRKQEEETREKEAKEAAEKDTDVHIVAQNTRSKSAQKLKKFHQYSEPAETQHHYITTAHEQQQYKPIQLYPQAQQHVHIPQSTPVHRAPVHTEAYEHKPQPAFVHHTPVQTSAYERKPQSLPVHQTPTHKPTYHEPKYNEDDNHAEVEKYYIQPQFTVIGHTKNEHGESELQYAANYEFGYRIRDIDHGNDYGHKETKDGESTKGEYHALLPDGRMQTVTYYVDDTGYHAEVSYAGESA